MVGAFFLFGLAAGYIRMGDRPDDRDLLVDGLQPTHQVQAAFGGRERLTGDIQGVVELPVQIQRERDVVIEADQQVLVVAVDPSVQSVGAAQAG